MPSKKAYFQGGGGVNQPTPGKPKYKVDKAITVQPRFVEPFYKNYDLYDVEGVDGPAHHGPGSGWNHINQFKSIKEFLQFRRRRLKGKYVADDSYIEDTPSNHRERVDKMKIRAVLLHRLVKRGGDNNDLGTGFYENLEHYKSVRDFMQRTPLGRDHGAKIKPEWERAQDVNDIDFPVDDDINHDTIIMPQEGQYHPPKLVGPSGTDDFTTQPNDEGTENIQIQFTSPQIAGEHTYVPLADFDGRSDDALNFGRDYDDESSPVGRTWDDNSDMDALLDVLEAKYLDDDEAETILQPAETEIYGLPDGVESEAKDADRTISTENPDYGIPDSGRQMYEDKWNI
jgi:hypothetical protein